MIYLDNNATTQVDEDVLASMLPYFREKYFNPSSMYTVAKDCTVAIDLARAQIASLLGIRDLSEIVFTSGATESNNHAIRGVLSANPKIRRIVTTAVEHPAVLELCRTLQQDGYEVVFVGVDKAGRIDIDAYSLAISEGPCLVSVMHANNETGVVFNIQMLAQIAKQGDSANVFHTDATQSVSKLPINVSEEFSSVDLLSFSGHKLHAPKGIGALFIRKGTKCRPFLLGGHQQAGLRAGTENVPYIVGLGKACEIAEKHSSVYNERILKLRERLELGVLEKIPYTNINGTGVQDSHRLPNTSSFAFHCIEGEGILYQLSSLGICGSSGSACTSGSLAPSHVLTAMQVPFTAIHGSLRLSLSKYNTEEEIDRVLVVLPEVVARLRRISPYWDVKTNKPNIV